jgi:hypothetical protein
MLDIYDMGNADDAFGIFSVEREDEEIGIGQDSETRTSRKRKRLPRKHERTKTLKMEKPITRRGFMRTTAGFAFGAAIGLKTELQEKAEVVLIRDKDALDANSKTD